VKTQPLAKKQSLRRSKKTVGRREPSCLKYSRYLG
jgi:hypothetical protein